MLVLLKQQHRKEVEDIVAQQDNAMQIFWQDVESVFADLQVQMLPQQQSSENIQTHHDASSLNDSTNL